MITDTDEMDTPKKRNRKRKSRRGNNEGTIFERHGWPYYVRVKIGATPDGRPRYKEAKAESRAHAQQLIRELQVSHQPVTATDIPSLTIKEAAEKYKAAKLTEPVYAGEHRIEGQETWEDRRRQLTAVVARLPDKPLADLCWADLKAYRDNRLKDPKQRDPENTVSIATVNRELSLLRSCLNWCIRQDWIQTNPFSRGEPLIQVSAEAKRDRLMTADEEERLIAACTGRRAHLRAILIAAKETAARCGELLKLQWRNVDLAKRTIFLTARSTKTNRGRIVPITARLLAELEGIWADGLGPDDFVFGGQKELKKAWASACKEAKIEGLRFHDIRHTGVTRFVREGLPQAQVMQISGHTQVSTFLRYANVDAEVAREIADHLDQNARNREKKKKKKKT